MPRKGPAPKRPLVADPVYQSPLVTQLVNKVLVDGKRSVAEAIVYGALEGARAKNDTDPVVTLKRALDNVKPALPVARSAYKLAEQALLARRHALTLLGAVAATGLLAVADA